MMKLTKTQMTELLSTMFDEYQRDVIDKARKEMFDTWSEWIDKCEQNAGDFSDDGGPQEASEDFIAGARYMLGWLRDADY